MTRARLRHPGFLVPADPTQLPIAARQLPNWPAYIALGVGAMAAGTTFADPVTGVPVTKMTSATSPAANTSMTHPYGSGGLQLSGPFGAGNDYTIYVEDTNSGAGSLIDYNRLTHARSNIRSTPWGSDLRFTFSSNPLTPQIAYYMTGTSHLKRFDTTSGVMAEAATTTFPVGGHDFTALIASQQLTYLQTDVNDRWFVFLNASGNAVYAWDSQTNTLLSCLLARCTAIRGAFTIDEPHFDKDGRYVYVKGGAYILNGVLQNHLLWDLQTDKLSDLFAGWSHSEGLRSVGTGVDANSSLGPNQRYIPAPVTVEGQASPGVLTTILTDSQLGAGEGHRGGQWIDQGSIGASAYVLLSVDCPGANRSTDAINLAWTLDAGAVYRATVSYQYQQVASGGIGDVLELSSAGTAVAARLTKAVSRIAMVAGSWFISGTTLYVWRNDGLSPDITTHRVTAQVPEIVHDGLAFVKLDGSAVFLFGHHYSFNPTADYWTSPRATISRDGKLVLADSVMNLSGGRRDVFVYHTPTQ